MFTNRKKRMKQPNRIVAIAVMTGILSGCANLPPLIQDHNGNYGLFLPTGQELMAALVYHQDAKFTVADGVTCILEHNTVNGHYRFLYPNASYIKMPGWKDMRYLGSHPLPDGNVIGIFQGTVNGRPGTEMMVVFHSRGINFTVLGGDGVFYKPIRMTQHHMIFRQTESTDPLLRIYSFYPNQKELSAPVSQSAVLEQVAQNRLQKERQAEQQQAQKKRQERAQRALREREREANAHSQYVPPYIPPALQQQQPAIQQSRMQMVVHDITIQGGSVQLQSSVPEGHQSIKPEAVNLQ